MEEVKVYQCESTLPETQGIAINASRL